MKPLNPSNARRASSAGAAVLLIVMSGCGGSGTSAGPEKPAPLPVTDGHVKFTNVPVRDTTPLNSFDPCAERIDELSGPLLVYYTARHHGPATIAELAPYALAGVPFESTCPVSKKEYLCARDGLAAPGENIRIYIYDAEPVHSGQRWCVVKDGTISGPPGFTTIHVPEERFQKFLPGSAPAPAVNP